MVNNLSKLVLFFLIISITSCKDEELVPVNTSKHVILSDKSVNRLKKVSIKKTNLKNSIIQINVTDLFGMIEQKDNADGIYLKFNLEEAKYVTGDNWDIAFYSRSIIVNGGTYVASAPYSAQEPERKSDAAIAIMGIKPYAEEIKPQNLVPISKLNDGDYLNLLEVPSDVNFKQDIRDEFSIDDNSKGMFDYFNAPKGLEHIVTIKKNRFLIIRTHKGHYAKLKIHSLYKEGGKTATSAISMDEAISEFFGYYTFSYNYNKVKGNKNLK